MYDVKIDIVNGRLTLENVSWALTRIKAIPGSRFDRSSGRWTLPLSWPSSVELGMVAYGSKATLIPSPAAREWMNSMVTQSKALSTVSEDLGKDKTVPMFFGHQLTGAEWLSMPTPGFPGRLLLDDTGAGKTRTVIEALTRIDQWPALVVTLNTVKESWRREIELVRPDLRVVVLNYGTPTEKKKALAAVESGELDIAVVNYESARTMSRLRAFPGQSLRRCRACGGPPALEGEDEITEKQCQRHARVLNRPWSVVVADEIHRMKDPTALQTQAMWGIGESAEMRWGLSGTIIANNPGDLWAPLHFIDPNAWPVKSKWIEMYCDAGYSWEGYFEVRGLDPVHKPMWDQWWNPINRRVLKEQVLDLPPLLRGGTLVRRVPMKPAQAKAYKELSETMVAEIEGGLLTVPNALVKAGRLTTLASASGAVVGDDEFILTTPSNKVETFIADWEAGDFPGSTVVAMSSRQLLMLLSKELERKGYGPAHVSIHGLVPVETRSNSIARFQAGEVPLLLMTYASGGTGITLTQASRIVLLQRDWSAVAMKQGIDRVHRIGSEIHDSVLVMDYITPDTIEEIQLLRLAEKEGALESIVQDKERIRNYLRGKI